MKYKIIYDKNKCIGAGECEAISPKLWKVNNKGKADLDSAKEVSDGIFELEISEEEYKIQEDVAGSCPVDCIKVVKEE